MFTHNGIKYILSNDNEKDEKGKLRCDLTLPTCIINNMEFPNCCLVKKNKPIERTKQPRQQQLRQQPQKRQQQESQPQPTTTIHQRSS